MPPIHRGERAKRLHEPDSAQAYKDWKLLADAADALLAVSTQFCEGVLIRDSPSI